MTALVPEKGPIPADVLEKMVGHLRDPTHAGVLREWAEDVETWAIHDGDLHLDGPLDAATYSVLFVLGDLHVGGLFQDSDDPETLVCVTGSLRAENLITSGWLEVQGDLAVSGAIIGDYNDCSAHVFGVMSARFFFPEEHHFEVGALDVTCAVGSHHRLGLEGAEAHFVSNSHGITPIAREAELRAVLRGEYLMSEEDVVYVFEGGKDHGDLMDAVSYTHLRAHET